MNYIYCDSWKRMQSNPLINLIKNCNSTTETKETKSKLCKSDTLPIDCTSRRTGLHNDQGLCIAAFIKHLVHTALVSNTHMHTHELGSFIINAGWQ